MQFKQQIIKQIILSIVSIAFDMAEMRRLNRALSSRMSGDNAVIWKVQAFERIVTALKKTKKANNVKASISLFTDICFSFALQCDPTWMRGNLGLKLQNSPILPRIHAIVFVVVQINRVDREKGLILSVTQLTRFVNGQ